MNEFYLLLNLRSLKYYDENMRKMINFFVRFANKLLKIYLWECSKNLRNLQCKAI